MSATATNASRRTILVVIALSDLLNQHPGLFDRGVMLGIPTQASFRLLLFLTEMVHLRYGLVLRDTEVEDAMLDAIGYCEEDHYENVDPYRYTEIDQHRYEQGMMDVAFRLRPRLPYPDLVSIEALPSEAFFRGTAYLLVTPLVDLL